jgi:leucyl/phenylalanyl-tRNA--protein transferase
LELPVSGKQSVLNHVSRSLANSGLYSKPAALALLAKHFIGFGPKLPNPERALRHPEGLAGRCPELNVPTMVSAYARGLYPAENKWWAPAERMVSFPENANVSKRVWGLLQTRAYGVTFDEDFAGVLRACAPEPPLTEAFNALHEAGYAHSVEVWDRSERLTGGLYGLAVGQAFFTERMFSRERDTVAVAFVTLTCHLQHWGFSVNDGKRMSGQLSQLGFSLVPRFAFNGLLAKATAKPSRIGKWSVEMGLDPARWNPKVTGTGRTKNATSSYFTLSS